MDEEVSLSLKIAITLVMTGAALATAINIWYNSSALLSTTQNSSTNAVATALSLFQGRDVAIVVQTKALSQLTGFDAKAINYGALIAPGYAASTASNKPKMMAGDASDIPAACANYDQKNENIITAQAKTAVIVEYGESSDSGDLRRLDGSPYYTAYLHNTNGLVDSSYDTIGTTELGNAAYLLSSARFSSVLIKDPTGSIIGIFFKQLQ